MRGFNPDIKVSIEGDARIIIDETKEVPSLTLEHRLMALTQEERTELLRDALVQYSDLERLIHTINRIQPEVQDSLFNL